MNERSLTRRVQRFSCGAVAACACAILAGCAGAPSSVTNTLSAMPGVSIAMDVASLAQLQKSVADGSITEAELRELRDRPTPPPPGKGFEFGTLRRSVAAMALADVDGTREAARVMILYGKDDQLIEASLGILQLTETISGNYRRAIEIGGKLEARWIEESRRTGQPILSSSTRIGTYQQVLAAAVDSGDAQTLAHLLKDYPEELPAGSRITERDRLSYQITRMRAKAAGQIARGDPEAAASELEKGGPSFAARIADIAKNSNPVQRAELEQTAVQVALTEIAVYSRLGRFAKAKQALEMLQSVTNRLNTKLAQGSYSKAAWIFYFATGNYPKALAAADEGWRSAPQFVLRFPLFREEQTIYAVKAAIANGNYAEGSRRIATLVPETSVKDGVLAAQTADIRSYLTAFEPSSKAVWMAEKFDPDMGRRIGSEESVIHFGAKAIVCLKMYQQTADQRDLMVAVDAGRKFSQSLRRIRATGLNHDLHFPQLQMRQAKTAYLVSVSAGQGRPGVSADDLLDAISLFQESTTDQDVTAAALRQKGIPGVSEADFRRLQDLQVAARTAQKELVNSSKASDADPKELARLEQNSKKAFQELEAIVLRVQAQAPNLAQAFAIAPPTVRSVQAQLSVGEVIAIFAPHETGTAALFISKSSAQNRTLPLTVSRQGEMVAALRASATFPTDETAAVPAFDTATAASLYAELFGWAPTSLSNAKELTVVAGGPLASIPFGLLLKSRVADNDYRRMPWLIKSMAISHAPSVTAWLSISGKPTNNRASSLMAWADPDFGGTAVATSGATRSVRRSNRSTNATQDDSRLAVLSADAVSKLLVQLPETRGEVEAIAKSLGNRSQVDIVFGKQATRSSVLESSRSGRMLNKSVVMFATHGLAPGQLPGLNQPALAMARDKNEIPLLTLEDVMSLRTTAEWVILSACNTSSAGDAEGDALSGLARGFFFAGAKSLLVTHWEVESQSAAHITVKTMEKYVANRSLSRSQALQQTAIDMIDAKKSSPEWSHPIYWAPYALVGGGGR